MDLAVVDVETTGILPGHYHRIIEIAIVRMDPNGRICDTLETLINPKRDLGPTHIHGIMGADVADAPTFEEIAGDVLAMLKGCVFVAHNAAFDRRFLLAELHRCQIPMPDMPHLCTMNLVRKAFPNIKQRALGPLCDALKIQYTNHHTAMSDALATSRLLEKAWSHLPSFHAPTNASWPNLKPSGKRRVRGDNQHEAGSSFISNLVARLPAPGDYDADMDAYLSLLDQALLDRIITPEEAHDLLQLATDLGLDQDTVMNAHRRYVRDLVWYALEDDVITEREDRDLRLVCQLLGVGDDQLQGMIQAIKAGEAPEDLRVQENDFVGKSVCFTGTLTCTRQGVRMSRGQAWELAREAGMTIAERVTKKLDYLVVADPNTQSNKARKAREYGIPVLSEVAFWLKLGVEVQ